MIHYFIKLFKANCLGSVSVKTAIILSWGFKINLFDTYSHNAAKRFSCVPAEQNKTLQKKCAYKVAQLFTSALDTTCYILVWAQTRTLETKALQPSPRLRGVNSCSLCVNLFPTRTYIEYEGPLIGSAVTRLYLVFMQQRGVHLESIFNCSTQPHLDFYWRFPNMTKLYSHLEERWRNKVPISIIHVKIWLKKNTIQMIFFFF